MFTERSLSSEVAAVRDEHAPGALVLDADADFETLSPAARDELATLVDGLAPASYPTEWLPDDAPELLRRFASTDFVVGMPGDGSITWTHQTQPPAVLVRARVQGSPSSFVDFLLAEAFVELGLDEPEQFLGFFGERYRALDTAVPLDAGSTYQIANALYEGYLGLHTREVFSTWEADHPELFAAWRDAGERIEPRVQGLTSELVRGGTGFADATELACSAIKHGVEPPAPFAALDTLAYREHGADYAVAWAKKTFEKLRD